MVRKGKTKFSWDNSLPEGAHLPMELFTEVLARLPPKTLLRFRSVCKAWCSLIDSRQFISLHHTLFDNNHSEKPILFAVNRPQCLEFTLHRNDTFRKIADLVTIPKPHEIPYSVMGYCNGLILMGTLFSNQQEEQRLLWNPTIRKSLILPPIPSSGGEIYYRCILGFAPSSNDYKVLAYTFKPSSTLEIAVYSLNDHHWRIKTNLTNVWGLHFLKSGLEDFHVPHGGALYWIVCDPQIYGIGFETKRTHLLSFDFEVEEFNVIQLPDVAKEAMEKSFFVLGESLAIFARTSQSIYIWIMENGSGEDPWKLWVSTDLSLDARTLFNSVEIQWFPLLYIEKSKALLMIENDRGRRRVSSYNTTSHTIQKLRKSISGQASLHNHVESLVMHRGVAGQTFTSFP